jgi:4'-phosphopantetheinyl transferase
MPPDSLAADIHPQPLELWCAYPDDLLDASVAAACAALLTPEEQARCEKLRFEPNRREFLASRALVRTALSRSHPLPPEAWRFRANSHGKPETDPACGLSFNISNAPGLVVCLIARGVQVGVDAEPYARDAEILPLAPDVFSPREQAQLHALPAAAQPDRALSLWTLKEAYIKARGLGLSLPLARFSFLFGGELGIHLEIDPALGDPPCRWRFRLLDHAGHRIALVAALPAAPALQLWESRLFAAPPRQLPLPPEPWFPR